MDARCSDTQMRHRLFRAFVLVVVVLVIWVPGLVALAMLLTGKAG